MVDPLLSSAISAQMLMKRGLVPGLPPEAREYEPPIPANFQRVRGGGGFGSKFVLLGIRARDSQEQHGFGAKVEVGGEHHPAVRR